jgi:cytoskeletal protein RodZ
MLFKFFRNNNNIGIASVLFLIVLVSQARILDFLFETFLGRILLISLIMFISYKNHILGVVSVLIVIIMFNTIGYVEGMENKSTSSPSTSSSSPSTSTSSPSTSTSITNAISKAKTDLMNKISSPTTTSDKTTSDKTTSDKTTSNKTTGEASVDDKSKKTNTSIEGFDLIGTENTIKRGKSSNSIPVYQQTKNTGHIAAYEGGSAYSAF